MQVHLTPPPPPQGLKGPPKVAPVVVTQGDGSHRDRKGCPTS